MFLSITVGVIDKIKERTFCELNFSPPYKDLRGKYIENARYIYMDRKFVHFFIVYKKKLNFIPIILENMSILEKETFLGKVGHQILLQLR